MSTDIFSSICANINSSLDDLGAFKRSFLYDDMEESSLLSLLTGMTYNRNGGKLGEGDLRPKALFADSTQLAAIIGSPKAAFKKHHHMCGLILQGYVCDEKKIPNFMYEWLMSCTTRHDVSAAKGKAKLSYKSAQIHILTPSLFDTNNVCTTSSVSTFHLRKITLLGVP